MQSITILFIIILLEYTINAADVSSNKCSTVRLQNGRVRARGRGKIIRFSCYEGYILVGNRYSTCIRGEWDTPTPVCVNSQCSDLTKPDHALVIPKYDGAILMYFCQPGYKLIGTSEIYCDGRQWNGSLPYCRDTSASAPTSCDFEKPDLCWWEQDPKHDFDWRRHNFETPSAHIGTGPTYDHTLGPGNDGYYLYIEASGRLVNDTARIISPIYNSSLTRSGCFSFWYHMYGDTIGALRVYFKSEMESIPKIMFNKVGNQGNRWINGVFRLPEIDSNFQILIEGVRGSNYVSDIAVDDVSILQGDECKEKNNTIDSTASDDDQIETLNAAQTCRGRCIYDTLLHLINTGISFSETYCHCTLDCAENSTCCPDYAEYCILDASSEIVDVTELITTLLPFKQTKVPKKVTREQDMDSTEKTLSSSVKTNKMFETSILMQNSSKFKSTLRSSAVEKTLITKSTMFNKNDGIKSKSTMELLFVTKEDSQVELSTSTIITINNVHNLTNGKKLHESYIPNHTNKEASQYIPPESSTSGLLSLIGGIIGILAGIGIPVIFIFVIYKRRKSYKRRKNGSSLSEDSDVRFLTSDEILDFNIARPSSINEYNEI